MNVGMIDISSKLSAKTAFIKPISEKRTAVRNKTNIFNAGFTTVNSG